MSSGLYSVARSNTELSKSHDVVLTISAFTTVQNSLNSIYQFSKV